MKNRTGDGLELGCTLGQKRTGFGASGFCTHGPDSSMPETVIQIVGIPVLEGGICLLCAMLAHKLPGLSVFAGVFT
jgi:hypothetical protein